MLLLAGTDRLDKALTIGQMQVRPAGRQAEDVVREV
jgi:hypothetical protein